MSTRSLGPASSWTPTPSGPSCSIGPNGSSTSPQRATVDEFRRRLTTEVAAIRRDDGEDRLRRQQAAVRVSTWTDNEGMWNLRGRFDPVDRDRARGEARHRRRDAVRRGDAGGVPDRRGRETALPGRPRRRPAVGGDGPQVGCGRVDPSTWPSSTPTHPIVTAPTVEWAIPVEIPARVLVRARRRRRRPRRGRAQRRRAARTRHARISAAPHGSRTATNAARCAACTAGVRSPGVRSRTTAANSTTSSGGATAGEPTSTTSCRCAHKHHAAIHRDDWVIALGPNRQLTLTLPDGTIHNTGPPTIRAA